MDSILGTYTYKIDHKGRLALTAELRRAAGKKRTLVLKLGLGGYLELFTEERWKKMEERLQAMSLGHRKARALQRLTYRYTLRVTVDAHGRITIPPALIDRAGLGKEAVLLGHGNKVEIWNPERLDASLAEIEPHSEDIAEEELE
jgi:MraZ protein